MTNHDRLLKYGYGIIRLSILFLFISFHYVSPRIVLFQSSYFPIFPFSFISSSSTTSHSLRLGLWLSRYHGCIYLGSIGAPINIKIYNFSLNLLLLVIGGVYCLYDSYIYRDYIILIYLLKTFTGDYLAGKLDTVEWKLVLFFIYGLVLPLHLYSDSQFPQNFHSYLPIFLYLFIIQFICEYGDNYYESWTFFRHRYSYEILNLLLVLLVPLTEYELSIVQYDMLICLWYRISNALYILYQTDIISIYLKILGFKLHGYIIGIPVVNVTDPEIAMLVMKNSNDKGLALERYIATPAWKPLISIESVDGKVWREMSNNFHALLPLLPSVSHLQNITKYHTEKLIHEKESLSTANSPGIIHAEDIARLTIVIFLDFLFGIRTLSDTEGDDSTLEKNHRINELYELFVQASWEWRKEISVRGKADPIIKSRTVSMFLNILDEPEKYVTDSEYVARIRNIYAKFGEKWRTPKYFSLILQPFLISPCINTGDIMVAISNHPDSPLEPAIRSMHPFPIFERYVSRDIHLPSSHPAQSSSPSPPVAVIKANTQVIMFTSDFLSSPYHWNIFGAGERICSGMHFALPFLKILYQSFHPLIRSEQETANHTSSARLNIRFRPELYHRYSGRNNDGKTSISELVYLFRLIIGIFYTKIMSKMFGVKSVEEKEEEEEQQLQQQQQQQSQVDKKVK